MNTLVLNDIFANITPGDEVLVSRDNKSRSAPYIILYCDARLFILLENNGIKHFFHSTMVRLYTEPHLPIKHRLNLVVQNTNNQ